MKRQLLTISLLLSLSLTACGTEAGRLPERETSTEPAPSESSASVEIPPEDTAETNYAFGKALWDACQLGVLPDGSVLDYVSMEGAAENSFALCDVDGDGQEELLLYWTNACMAGNRLDVFGCSSGEVYTELTVFPLVIFYDNGIVKADHSHNQGLSGDKLWPYDLYSYNASTDTYEIVGGADGWDQEYGTTDAVGSVPFPTDIDADGDGMIYFLLPADWDGHYMQDAEHGPDWVDGSAYETWRNSYLDRARPLTISTQKLTEDNISALGCPKPEVSAMEPVG